ncbi:MAG: NAD(P)H-hydrate dehydratase [Ignavibacteriales bacterium]|nr:MAG: NAD(P)H-hydrate dehydratase [Ignavibacteriales bacterium]
MIPLFSTFQVREADRYAIEQLGIHGQVLMENASYQIFEIVRDKILYLGLAQKIGFVCGKGNNGGDGYAAARHFYNFGFDVTVISIGDESEMTKDCLSNFRILKQLAVKDQRIRIISYQKINSLKHLKDCSIIVDAVLGTGVSGSLKEPYDAIIKNINEIDAYKVAVDIPTGLNGDTGSGEIIFKADLTVTLGEFKKGLFIHDGYANCGDIVKGYIGLGFSYFDKFESEEYLIEPEDVFKHLPVKEKNIHKYTAGKVLTIAGSTELPGAAALTAMAVLKSGAGASVVAVPFDAKNYIYKNNTELVVRSYGKKETSYLTQSSIKDFDEKLSWADVIVIGPGLGRQMKTQEAIIEILKANKTAKVVIDADAVFALSDKKYSSVNLKNSILTPHIAEFAQMIGKDITEIKKDIFSYGKKFAVENKTCLVLKGAPTIIFNSSGDALINTAGNPGMAKFGTGDVLSGVIGGLLAQSKSIESAVISGVYLHSLAADLLMKDFTVYSFTAADILNNIPGAFRFIRDTFA